jgi:hypothetical protein
LVEFGDAKGGMHAIIGPRIKINWRQPTSRVPSATISAVAVSPPAPNWMASSGFALSPAALTALTGAIKSLVGAT